MAPRWLMSGCAVLFCLTALAQPGLRPLPPLLRTLSDEAGVLSPEQGLKLSRSLEQVLDRTGVRVVIVVAETTAPEAIEDYTERLAQRWKRERQLDPERSIFVVLAVHDREMQVMPGKALAHVDRELTRSGVLADLVPLLREKRYFDALMIVNERLYRLLRPAARRDMTTITRTPLRRTRLRPCRPPEHRFGLTHTTVLLESSECAPPHCP